MGIIIAACVGLIVGVAIGFVIGAHAGAAVVTSKMEEATARLKAMNARMARTGR